MNTLRTTRQVGGYYEGSVRFGGVYENVWSLLGNEFRNTMIGSCSTLEKRELYGRRRVRSAMNHSTPPPPPGVHYIIEIAPQMAYLRR